jgi:predicted lipid carrier protein YhbT
MPDTTQPTGLLRFALLIVAALLVGACDGGRAVPAKTTVRVVHAAPTVAPVVFRRVQADATVSVGFDDFQKLAQGALDPTMAFMQGKLKVAGDMGVAMKLQSLFSKLK